MTRKMLYTFCTLRHPKMHPHTKFGIPRDGRMESAITTCLPKFLWGHKNFVNLDLWAENQADLRLTQAFVVLENMF